MALSKEAQEARREYKRRWNAANKDKVKAAQERYWDKVAAQQAADTQETTDKPIIQEAS